MPTLQILQKPKEETMETLNTYNGIEFTYANSVDTLRAQTDRGLVAAREGRAGAGGIASIVTLLDMVHYLRHGGFADQNAVAKGYGVSKAHVSKACKVVREGLTACVAKQGKAFAMSDDEVATAVVQYVAKAGLRTGINSLYEDLGVEEEDTKVFSFDEEAAKLLKRGIKRGGMSVVDMMAAFTAVAETMVVE